MTTNFEREFAARDRADVLEAWVQLNTAIKGHMMPLSLTYDHRTIDGAAAARFMV